MAKKRGQTLILMVILIPMMIGIMALVVDVGYLSLEKSHMKEVTKTIIKQELDQEIDKDRIKKEFKNNKIAIDNLEIEKINDKLNIKNEVKIESIFGAIIGLKEYKIKIDITGYKDNNKIKFE